MVNLDLIVVGTFARLILGGFVSAAFGIIGWLVALWVFQFVPFTSLTFPLVSVFTVGLLAGLGAVLAWWNWETPWRAKLMSMALILSMVLLSSWLTYLVTTSNSYYTWIEGGVIFPMLNIAVAVGNFFALGIFVFRSVKRREI